MQKIQLSEYLASYYESGTGRPLVFLHGFLSDCHAWDSLVPLLSSHYRCICLDLLGFGDSSIPDIAYTVASEVEFLDEFIKYLNLEDYTLIGHSFGGWISTSFALHKSNEFLKNIILLAPGGIRDDNFKGSYKYLLPLLLPNKFIDMALNSVSPFLLLIGFKKKITQFRKIREAFRNKPVASSFFIRRYFDKNPDRETVDHLLDGLDIETLVISGEADNVIPLWHAQVYVNKIRRSDSLFIPDAAHDLIETHSRIIADKILEIIPTKSEINRSLT